MQVKAGTGTIHSNDLLIPSYVAPFYQAVHGTRHSGQASLGYLLTSVNQLSASDPGHPCAANTALDGNQPLT